MNASKVARNMEELELQDPRETPQPLKLALKQAEEKIREDLFRFRTCCADPRASK